MTPHEKAIEIAKEVIEEWTGDFRGEEIILAQAVLEQAAEIKRLRDKYDFQLLVKRNEALEDELADHKQIALLAKAEADRNREIILEIQNADEITRLKNILHKWCDKYGVKRNEKE